MLSRIGDSAKLGQQPGLRRWLVFALVGALVAFSLLLFSKEAQAKAKHSPVQGSAVKGASGGASGGASKQAGETLKGAGKPAGDREIRGKEARGNVAPASPAPQLDKPAGAEPVLEKATSQTGKALGEVVEPIGETARPAVEPVLDKATSATEPVLEEANPLVEPALEEATPVVEPVLDKASLVVEPVGEAIEPVTRPLLGAASPAVEPVLEGVVSPVEAAPMVVEPAFETAAPVGGPGFGEEVVSGSDELAVIGRVASANLPMSPSAISSPALAVGAWSTFSEPQPAPVALANTRDSSSHGSAGKTQPPKVELLGSHFELFDRSSTVGRHHTLLLLGATAAKGAQDRIPPPSFPFGFPSGTLPVGRSLGGSGPGTGLDFSGILALFLILSRVGGLAWSSREAFKLGSSLQLAVERPG